MNNTANNLKNYKILSFIGKGTYGTVILCKNGSNNDLMVLKEIPVYSTRDELFEETQNEIKVLSTLSHPCIIKYFESFYENNCVYIAMEYATNGNLAQYMFQRNKCYLPQNEILHFFTQILLGVQFIHEKKIIHRDIKAENILLSGLYGNLVKIGDFGIAKFIENGKASTVIGTPYYLAPELCENKSYDTKTDVWALGCLLYEMCTHQRAFEATTLLGLVNQIISGNIHPIDKNLYDHEMQELIDNMLTVVPEKRHSVDVLLTRPIIRNVTYTFFFINLMTGQV